MKKTDPKTELRPHFSITSAEQKAMFWAAVTLGLMAATYLLVEAFARLHRFC